MADPVTAIVSSIVSSIINSVMDAPPEPPQVPASTAISRAFPANTAFGELTSLPANQQIQIDGKVFNTAPGLQIRNELNMIVLPASLQGSNQIIRYQLDTMGSVWRVWLLSAAEVQAANLKR